ncbi:MAG: ATP-binding protein [Pseudanabaenales cyanobacterium]|nr:ATP-binding protein [Pseudanabaenales cyanobacterium]
MRCFLRETWELWYWAMFCPSRLQQRMNAWAPVPAQDEQRPDTLFSDILLLRANPRFISQYLLLILGFSLPLLGLISASGQAFDWLLLPSVLLITYGIGVWFLPMSLHVPLLFSLTYSQKPELYAQVVESWLSLSGILPPLSKLAEGLAIGTVVLMATLLFVRGCLQQNHLFLARKTLFLGGTFSVLLGSWFATQNWLPAILLTSLTGIFLYFYQNQISSNEDADGVAVIVAVVAAFGMAVVVAFGVADGVVGGVADEVERIMEIVVANGVMNGVADEVADGLVGDVARVVVGGVAGGMAGGVAFIVAVVVASSLVHGVVGSVTVIVTAIVATVVVAGSVAGGVADGLATSATLPLPWFVLICGLVAVSLASAQQKWLGFITALVLVALGVENLGLKSLLAIPVTFLGYNRLLPDWLVWLPLSLLPSLPWINRFDFKPLQFLELLPPHKSELLWLPLPNHDRILADAFRINPSAALSTFQQMQASSLPSFNITLKQARPQIVADQLAAVNTIPELLLTATREHPLLPLLAPTFYQSETELEEQTGSWPLPEIDTELSTLLPRLQGFAKDIDAALKAGNAALRERGLERILHNLGMLQAQLPGLGLSPRTVKRWRPVLERWQRVVQLELEHQQAESQGELINPFQYGTPLRQDRTHLFKGRQAFADEIVRLILDRNRPTLVLHGPRRCGKSSFLLNLSRLLPSDVLPVYLDMQSAAITTDEAALCQGLVRAIRRDSHSQGVELPTIPNRQAFLDRPYIVLEDWLKQALPKLGDRRLLLNLDEFEKIGSAIRDGKISKALLNELRHLIQPMII